MSTTNAYDRITICIEFFEWLLSQGLEFTASNKVPRNFPPGGDFIDKPWQEEDNVEPVPVNPGEDEVDNIFNSNKCMANKILILILVICSYCEPSF